MDFTNTVKVNNIRAAVAIRSALVAFDAALPELQEIAAGYDAALQAEYDAIDARIVAEMAEHYELVAEWNAYDITYKRWRGGRCIDRICSTPPTKPAKVRPTFFRRGVSLHNYSGSHTSFLASYRKQLKNKLAIATMSMGPYRISHAEAIELASLEDGSFINEVKRNLKQGGCYEYHATGI